MLNDLLAKHFQVLLDPQVVREVSSALDRAYHRWRAAGLVTEDKSEIKARHARWIATHCSCQDADQRWLDLERVSHLDGGEMACIALARHTADELLAYVLMLTDDYDAAHSAERIFKRYQCGMVIGNDDLIIFFGMRLKLSKSEIHQALRTVISFYSTAYEDLLEDAESLLAGGRFSYILAAVRRSEFDAAKNQIVNSALPRTKQTRLVALIDQVSSLSDPRSTLGKSLLRLRGLAEMQLP